MKAIRILLLFLIPTCLFSQEITEKEISSKVNEVTVFFDGAQIVRKKDISLPKGKTILKFTNLSPFIDAKSVQVKAVGELTVLSVNHQQNFIDKMEASEEMNSLQNQLLELNEKINLEKTHLSIITEELSFLKENRDIGGKNEQVSVTNLQQASDFYSKKLTALKLKEIERNKTLKELNNQKRKIQQQIRTLTSKKEYPQGEILVKVDAKLAKKFPIELTYLVNNAGWYPSYDIRAENIEEPIQLTYKANVRQDTKVDWTNVKLKFSSAEPNLSGVAPELKTYYLDYNTLPPVYRKNRSNTVSGRITGNDGSPLPGATVIVDGTTIGTTSDSNGKYSITLPNGAEQLVFSYIGFESKTKPIRGERLNVTLNEDVTALEEVAVLEFAEDVDEVLQGQVAGISTKKSNIRIRGARKIPSSSLAIPVEQVKNQTTVDFDIKTPYSLKSDNKNYVVDMANYEMPTSYQYYCVPKIEKDAFLIAYIEDWEQYNLLAGEANLYFEDTYVGKTLMDVTYASDTLEISLGRDKQVAVNRQKMKEFTKKQFIGNKKEESRAWQITVRNNKSQSINMIMLDQIPVSTSEDIEVQTQTISGAKLDELTGEVKWEFDLNAGENKELDLKYSVKYPKNKYLVVE